MPVSTTSPLERDGELAALGAAVGAAGAGEGNVVVIEGPAGIGKTMLLGCAADSARAANLTLLTARGVELESEFAFGAVRQLLEQAAHDCPPELFAGPAALAAPLLSAASPPRAAAPPTSEEASYAVVHGLYWLTVNLARRGPIALIVDDAHWVDQSSLRYLAYLAARRDTVDALVVLATRTDDPGHSSLPRELTGKGTIVLRPNPLSARAAEELVSAELPGAEPRICEACHVATAGNPLFLRELIGALAEAGPAHSTDVLQSAPAGVRSVVAARIARLPEAARALARAVAVLGSDVPLRHAAEVASLDPGTAALVADELAQASILEPGRPLRFVHPIVRAALLDDLAPAARAVAHDRAARLLAADRAPAERIAAHLLGVEARADPWSCARLVEAGVDALARGAPEAAVTYLRRALQEPPADDYRATVLLELGYAEALTFQPHDAIEHLRAGISLSPDPDLRLRAAVSVGMLMANTATVVAANDFMAGALAEAPDADPVLVAQVEGHMAVFARSDPAAWRHGTTPLVDALRRMQAGGPGAPAGLATAAADMAMRGVPAEQVVGAAKRALDSRGGVASPGDFTVAMSGRCLLAADRLDDADAALDPEIEALRARGGQLLALPLRIFRAESLRRRGRLVEAEEMGRQAVADARGWRAGMPAAVALLVLVLIDRGRAREAIELLSEQGFDGPIDALPPNYQVTMALHARGAARLAVGELRAAAADLLACGERLEEIEERNPALLPWQSLAARALAGQDEVARACELAAEELAVARRFGAPRALSIALRALAAVDPRADRLSLLREAVALTADSPAVLECGEAIADLGTSLVEQGQPDEARPLLERALDIAERCEAPPLRRRTLAALARTGRRPRRPRSGPAALTPAEQRIAQLAAEGLLNRQIAERLVVTPRTVEFHLTNTYRKLQITSRRDLATALEVSANR
jgi:DNA-binding NarL/FixJ family response regulator